MSCVIGSVTPGSVIAVLYFCVVIELPTLVVDLSISNLRSLKLAGNLRFS